MRKKKPNSYRAGNYERFCEYEDGLPSPEPNFYDDQDLALQRWLNGDSLADIEDWDFYGDIDEESEDAEDFYNACNPKLEPEDVEEVRRMYEEEDYTQQELADMFDIRQSMISMIINRKRWF